jgi:hypothetical protein
VNNEDLRDCFAMFALLRMSFGNDGGEGAERYAKGANQCYLIADAMLEARNKQEDDDGIATIKKRKYVRKD